MVATDVAGGAVPGHRKADLEAGRYTFRARQGNKQCVEIGAVAIALAAGPEGIAIAPAAAHLLVLDVIHHPVVNGPGGRRRGVVRALGVNFRQDGLQDIVADRDQGIGGQVAGELRRVAALPVAGSDGGTRHREQQGRLDRGIDIGGAANTVVTVAVALLDTDLTGQVGVQGLRQYPLSRLVCRQRDIDIHRFAGGKIRREHAVAELEHALGSSRHGRQGKHQGTA